jgi:hypothetical protein
MDSVVIYTMLKTLFLVILAALFYSETASGTKTSNRNSYLAPIQSQRPAGQLPAGHQVKHRVKYSNKSRVTNKSKSKKPVIFFPSGEENCETSKPAAFNTFSFLAFVLAAYNLISLIVSNANNNNNNNNNDNNNNNIINEVNI